MSLSPQPCADSLTALNDGLMSKITQRASAIALAATAIAALVSADTGAAARDMVPALILAEPQPTPLPTSVSEPVVQPLPEASEAPGAEASAPSITSDSLAGMVAAQPSEPLSRELECLAGAIYFEAKSESLTGQLAVGRVIVARSRSGRFPASYCGVVFQPSQFSFVRGHGMPEINRASAQWRNASAIARIADAGTWQSPVEGALFFHAARVSPGWHLTRLGRLENHVFYR